MKHIVIFCLSALGFLCLALAMQRHQEDLFGKELARKPTLLLRMAGWAALLAALAAAVETMGLSLGLVSYSGHLSAGAAVVALSLVARERLAGRAR